MARIKQDMIDAAEMPSTADMDAAHRELARQQAMAELGLTDEDLDRLDARDGPHSDLGPLDAAGSAVTS